MKRVLLHAAVLTLLAAAAVGGLLAWRMRPWRAAVSVNGHAMSARELDMRAQTLLDDARRVEHLVYAKGRERVASPSVIGSPDASRRDFAVSNFGVAFVPAFR